MPYHDATYPCDQRLARAAPALLEAARHAVHALNTAPRFRCGVFNSYDIASMCDAAIAAAEGLTTECSDVTDRQVD